MGSEVMTIRMMSYLSAYFSTNLRQFQLDHILLNLYLEFRFQNRTNMSFKPRKSRVDRLLLLEIDIVDRPWRKSAAQRRITRNNKSQEVTESGQPKKTTYLVEKPKWTDGLKGWFYAMMITASIIGVLRYTGDLVQKNLELQETLKIVNAQNSNDKSDSFWFGLIIGMVMIVALKKAKKILKSKPKEEKENPPAPSGPIQPPIPLPDEKCSTGWRSFFGFKST